MTLYGYFASKDELLDAVVDAAVPDREPFVLEGTPREQLRGVADGRPSEPPSPPQLGRAPGPAPGAAPRRHSRFAEAILSILVAAGLDRAEAAPGASASCSPTRSASRRSSPGEVTEEHRRAARAARSELPSNEYPSLAGAIVDEASDAMGGEEAFQIVHRILRTRCSNVRLSRGAASGSK